MARDDFSKATIEALAKRAGMMCSFPDCNRTTIGPGVGAMEVASVGTAAHITAAAPGGPRFDASLTPEQRSSIDNGVWLCADHGRLVDADRDRYSADELRAWRKAREATQQLANERRMKMPAPAEAPVVPLNWDSELRSWRESATLLAETTAQIQVIFRPVTNANSLSHSELGTFVANEQVRGWGWDFPHHRELNNIQSGLLGGLERNHTAKEQWILSKRGFFACAVSLWEETAPFPFNRDPGILRLEFNVGLLCLYAEFARRIAARWKTTLECEAVFLGMKGRALRQEAHGSIQLSPPLCVESQFCLRWAARADLGLVETVAAQASELAGLFQVSLSNDQFHEGIREVAKKIRSLESP